MYTEWYVQDVKYETSTLHELWNMYYRGTEDE